MLEIEPYHWSDRALPQGPSREHPVAWYTYFHQCMADAGITGIDPIRPGSHFVDAFSVVDNELIVRLIREELTVRAAALREAIVRAEASRNELARRLLARVREVIPDPDRAREVRDRLMAIDLG